MAVVCINGFEAGQLHPGWLNQSQGQVTVGSGRDGIGIAFRQTGNLGASFQQVFTSGSDTIFVHWGIYFASGTWGAGLALITVAADNGATSHVNCVVDGSGHLVLRRGTTVLATSANTFGAAATWYSFQAKVTIHDTTGEFTVKVNGVEWVTYTGDTKNAGTSTRPDRLTWSVNNDTTRLDDLVVLDTTGSVANDWPGELSVVGIRPAGNGANSGLTGSDGNSTDNYQQVDEYPFITTDYNGSATVGAKDTYNMTNVGKTGTVLAVQAFAQAVKSDAGAKSFKHLMRAAGGTEVTSSTVTLTTTSVVYAGPIWATDADGAAWTVASVDAHEFGMQVEA
jgi:hypothetical protein